jgi:hypothetical protein
VQFRDTAKSDSALRAGRKRAILRHSSVLGQGRAAKRLLNRHFRGRTISSRGDRLSPKPPRSSKRGREGKERVQTHVIAGQDIPGIPPPHVVGCRSNAQSVQNRDGVSPASYAVRFHVLGRPFGPLRPLETPCKHPVNTMQTASRRCLHGVCTAFGADEEREVTQRCAIFARPRNLEWLLALLRRSVAGC